jgi:hypothetical protein
MEKLAIVNLTIRETASSCLHHIRNNIQYAYGVYFGAPKQNCKSDAHNTALALVHAMKHLLLFLSLLSIGSLYNYSSSKGAKMLTGKWCLQADAASTHRSRESCGQHSHKKKSFNAMAKQCPKLLHYSTSEPFGNNYNKIANNAPV